MNEEKMGFERKREKEIFKGKLILEREKGRFYILHLPRPK